MLFFTYECLQYKELIFNFSVSKYLPRYIYSLESVAIRNFLGLTFARRRDLRFILQFYLTQKRMLYEIICFNFVEVDINIIRIENTSKINHCSYFKYSTLAISIYQKKSQLERFKTRFKNADIQKTTAVNIKLLQFSFQQVINVYRHNNRKEVIFFSFWLFRKLTLHPTA